MNETSPRIIHMYKQLTIIHFALETVSVVLKQSHNHEIRNFEKSELITYKDSALSTARGIQTR